MNVLERDAEDEGLYGIVDLRGEDWIGLEWAWEFARREVGWMLT